MSCECGHDVPHDQYGCLVVGCECKARGRESSAVTQEDVNAVVDDVHAIRFGRESSAGEVVGSFIRPESERVPGPHACRGCIHCTPAYRLGFAAGRASRDAEVERLRTLLMRTERMRAEARRQLAEAQAENARLRAALLRHADEFERMRWAWDAGDSRREDVMRLAKDARALATTKAESEGT